MNNRAVLTWVLVLTGLVASWGAWQLRPQPPANDTIGPPRSDYTADAYHLVVMNKVGGVSFTSEGPYLARNLNDESLAQSHPVYHFPYKKDQGAYAVHAETGWVSAKGEEVRLAHAVVVDGPIIEDQDQTHLHTEQMTVFPQYKTARSDLLVTANRGASIMDGVGMNANLDTNRIELLSKVSLHNVPVPKH
ncbi:MAG TPA: LPS export ABC transporter periplasmic protein LptC [Xanthomonadaceae bacterium]|jgi:lipopolysaccharide export system protein LptC|nr:LPS export ABC transporter periplasmic protein LptC [Xanthomonadaceae bacterium]